MVWTLFILLTTFQMMANTFHAYINLEDYIPWIELFGLEDEEPIYQKRVLSMVSGAVLPIIALGFIKSLVDYIRPNEEEIISEVKIHNEEEMTDEEAKEYVNSKKENLEKKKPNKITKQKRRVIYKP